AVERMMKLQDVILKAMAKKISWLDAAEIIGVCDRTMRRMRENYQQFGYTGLRDRRSGKESSHRVPMETAEEVLRLYREVYFDLNMPIVIGVAVEPASKLFFAVFCPVSAPPLPARMRPLSIP